MNILISGASGFVGTHLLATLRRHHHLKACVRNPDKLQRSVGVAIETVETDFARMCDVEDWIPILSGIDAVINCIGIIAEDHAQKFQTLHTRAPQALFEAAKLSGVRKVIQISAL